MTTDKQAGMSGLRELAERLESQAGQRLADAVHGDEYAAATANLLREIAGELRALATRTPPAGEDGPLVQVTRDPSFPTFDFDFGDMSAAMAALPEGTEYVRIVPAPPAMRKGDR